MKVCAIVVTFNRKELLKECINSLLTQNELPDGIIIIDNNSNDGTMGYLDENGIIDKESCLDGSEINKEIYMKNSQSENNIKCVKIYYKIEKINTGGAGGFYTGLKISIEKGYKYSWIMDDDAIAMNGALYNLLEAENILHRKFGFLASNIKSDDGYCMNVPQIDLSVNKTGYSNWPEYIDKGLIPVKMATFVSILVNNNIVRKIGLPVKEMFIWGDDSEFTLRISEKYKCYSVGKSLVTHKRVQVNTLSIIKEKNKNRIDMFFYYYRNQLYFKRKYLNVGVLKIFKNNIKDIFEVLFTKGDYRFKKSFVILKGSILGLFFNPSVKFPNGDK